MQFYVNTIISNLEKTKDFSASFLVDTGAKFTIAPARMLEKIGAPILDQQKVVYANGQVETVPITSCWISVDGFHRQLPCSVLFGKGDICLLGMETLETLSLGVDTRNAKLFTIEALEA